MANRTLSKLLSVDRAQCFLSGSWATNGTSNPVATTVKGTGYTVARTGVGTYQIQTTEPFTDVIAWDANINLGTPSDYTIVGTQPVQVTVGTSKRWQYNLTIFSGAAAADLAAAAGNAVSFFLVFQHSGSKPY